MKSIFSAKANAVFGLTLFVLTACSGGGSADADNNNVTGGGGTGGNTNSAPSVSITSHSNGDMIDSGTTITLVASASDAEDGDISSNVDWSSDVDGFLGTGASFMVSLSDGDHIITASVTDSANASGQDTVTLKVVVSQGVATVSWVAPTENNDNSTLTDLSGFVVYYGTSQSNLSQSITINDPTLTSVVLDTLFVNTTYYFQVTAFNSKGVESSPSNMASKHISG